MPDIYTTDWYEAVKDAINAAVDGLRDAPEGAWTICVEIVGDGMSPYAPADGMRRFLIRIEAGICLWYRELDAEAEDKLDYRFTGPATVFDEIAASVLDPLDAVLHGAIKVRGDMRFLLRQAELVNVLLGAYTSGVDTTWPAGSPPYAGAEVVTGA
jgi:hypothetical protein